MCGSYFGFLDRRSLPQDTSYYATIIGKGKIGPQVGTPCKINRTKEIFIMYSHKSKTSLRRQLL